MHSRDILETTRYRTLVEVVKLLTEVTPELL